ncbi:MAG: helix-turn-helix domain-containing protein [Tistlia sp.]|uniref:helix-turn-helix domain-containing protein n=1 Tax=Tistlia sp. TaxID=3057121 RepID=UPI0034A1AB04
MEGTNEKVCAERGRVLPSYTEDLLGMPVVLRNAAIQETDPDTGEETIEIPDMEGLVAAMAMARCLLPLRLSGAEVRFLRKALELTQKEFSDHLEVSAETVSRWESEAQPMGGFSEKLLRHFVCGEMQERAPAIDFEPSMINHMRIMCIADVSEVPPMVFERVTLKDRATRDKHREWDTFTDMAA